MCVCEAHSATTETTESKTHREHLSHPQCPMSKIQLIKIEQKMFSVFFFSQSSLCRRSWVTFVDDNSYTKNFRRFSPSAWGRARSLDCPNWQCPEFPEHRRRRRRVTHFSWRNCGCFGCAVWTARGLCRSWPGMEHIRDNTCSRMDSFREAPWDHLWWFCWVFCSWRGRSGTKPVDFFLLKRKIC